MLFIASTPFLQILFVHNYIYLCKFLFSTFHLIMTEERSKRHEYLPLVFIVNCLKKKTLTDKKLNKPIIHACLLSLQSLTLHPKQFTVCEIIYWLLAIKHNCSLKDNCSPEHFKEKV